MTAPGSATGSAAGAAADPDDPSSRASGGAVPRAAELFGRVLGGAPDAVFSAPGRVNLIGEHTDYNQGLVLPFAIDARAQVAVRARDDGRLRVVSGQQPGETVEVNLDGLEPGAVTGWAGYVAGAAWALAERGHRAAGADLALDSTVPVGAGLSSSAAVECSTALALATLAGDRLAPEELARVAQLDENRFVGVPCGLMDQMASSASRAGTVLFFDVGADRTEHIPFDPATAGLVTLLVDTRAHHSLADGQYARRRATCEAAAETLGVDSLSRIAPGELDAALAGLGDDETRRRVRHVVTENERVRAVVELLRTGAVRDIGPAMVASHASLRDDFEVSCAELDVAVDAALAAGAAGARMTGGGFGGSVIALVDRDRVDEVGAAVTGAFARAGFTAPVLRLVSPADGAGADG
ncbi:galactokinase [Nakamurella endophytica]|uniref:Galactokinase n=1 Tax=Nakamurella endophytica TaxID=1748367 RepID=A0A917STD5_9ACTN|nr:galactokinase [Nakamurella endophytica]GGL96511.1 galactokinase [Nakamurella endophytica]